MRNSYFLIAILSLAAGCGVDAPEDVAPPAGDDVSGRGSERHCLVRMEPGDSAGPAKIGALACYGSISEVMVAATGGRVVLPAGTRAGEIDEDMLAAAGYDPASAAFASYVIGIDYTEPYYSGSSLTWTAPYGCYDPYGASYRYWYAPGMPFGWDNVISSSQTFSYCRSTVYNDYPNQGGSSVSYSCDAPVFTWMDNAASSQAWFPHGYCTRF